MSIQINPDYIGTIVNFASTEIDNDGLPYFEFALNPTSNPQDQKVLYINLLGKYADLCVPVATYALAQKVKVHVWLDPAAPKMRVRNIAVAP